MIQWVLNTEQAESIARAIFMDIPQYINEHSEEFALFLESEQSETEKINDSKNII